MIWQALFCDLHSFSNEKVKNILADAKKYELNTPKEFCIAATSNPIFKIPLFLEYALNLVNIDNSFFNENMSETELIKSVLEYAFRDSDDNHCDASDIYPIQAIGWVKSYYHQIEKEVRLDRRKLRVMSAVHSNLVYGSFELGKVGNEKSGISPQYISRVIKRAKKEGIIQSKGADIFFTHQVIQEHLAAAHLARAKEKGVPNRLNESPTHSEQFSQLIKNYSGDNNSISIVKRALVMSQGERWTKNFLKSELLVDFEDKSRAYSVSRMSISLLADGFEVSDKKLFRKALEDAPSKFYQLYECITLFS